MTLDFGSNLRILLNFKGLTPEQPKISPQNAGNCALLSVHMSP